MSVDLKGNCGICLYPLSNGKKLAYHETYTNEYGQVCDGSLHPLHLECATEALEQSGSYCSTCRAPIKPAVEIITFDTQKMEKFKTTAMGVAGVAGFIVSNIASILYLPPELISMTTILGIGAACCTTEGILDRLYGKPQFLDKMGWVKRSVGVKMITVDPKPPKKLRKNCQPQPGYGGYMKPMQRRHKSLKKGNYVG